MSLQVLRSLNDPPIRSTGDRLQRTSREACGCYPVRPRVPTLGDTDGTLLSRLPLKTSTPAERGSVSMFSAIDHVGVAVVDLDAAVRFYEDTFDMKKVHEEVNEDQ